MIDHISLGVRDLSRSLVFYDGVLAALGYFRLWTAVDAAGYGLRGSDEPFAIKEEKGEFGGSARTHLAFTAQTREQVAAFHRAALLAGGTDDGPPGPRPAYGENYFAAFVRDPDGFRLEAVCHRV